MLMQGHESGPDPEGIEEMAAVARILGRHEIHRAQHFEGPRRDVAQIPKRSRNDIQ